MNKRKILPATLAAVLATGMVTSAMTPVLAMSKAAPPEATVSKKEGDAKNKAVDEELVKVSEDAQISLRDLRGARLAIFDGDTDRAQTYVDAARTRIAVANKEAEKYALDIKAPKKEDLYVPIDASLTVLHAYEPTDENVKHIARANKHLRKGEQKKALETLKLSDIDVAVSTGLVPVKFAKENIDKASTLVRQGKYYEANLVLKDVDDAVVIQTYGVDEVPKAKAGDKATTDDKVNKENKSG